MSIEKPDIVVKESLRTTDVPIANKVTAGDINEIKRSIDDTVDVVNGTPSGTDYWKVYHVNQELATDDSGDGTKDAPFYTIRAALDAMNAAKLDLGINPGELSEYKTRIVVWGTPKWLNVMRVHRESLLITAWEFVDFHITTPYVGVLAPNGGVSNWVRWVPAPVGELGSMSDEFEHAMLPPLMVTNLRRQEFIEGFIQDCWDTRVGSVKDLIAYSSFSDTGFTNSQLGAWQGGDLVGEVPPTNNTLSTTNIGTRNFWFGAEIEGFFFNSNSYSDNAIDPSTTSWIRTLSLGLPLIIAGRPDIGSTATIIGQGLRISGCNSVFAKNVAGTSYWRTASTMVLDNCDYTSSLASVDPWLHQGVVQEPTIYKVMRARTDLSSGGIGTLVGNNYIVTTACDSFHLQGSPLTSENIALPHTLNCGNDFSVIGDININQASITKGNHVNASRFFYIASTRDTHFGNVTCNALRKRESGLLTITHLTVGREGLSNENSTSLRASSGTLTVSALTCSGNVYLEGDVVANLSGTILGNLTVEAGATLNATSLTVKGDLTFEAGATVVWENSVYTGALIDPDDHIGEDVSLNFSEREYWRTYHVNQEIANPDDSGDGSFSDPFYTVHAALEKMNEEKALLGIAPGEISDYITKIVVYGTIVSGNRRRHYESLLITRQQYAQWHICAGPHFTDGYPVLWAVGQSNVEDYNGWVLPPLIITNMAKADFVNNFLKYCWDTQEGGYKSLHDLVTYGSTYGENPIDAFTSTISGNGREVGPWKGGPLLGTTQFDEVSGSGSTTHFYNCALEGLYFSLGTSFLRPMEGSGSIQAGCFFIGGMNANSEYGSISMTYLTIKNCEGFYFKNVRLTGHLSPIVYEEYSPTTVFDNAAETRNFYTQGSNLFLNSNFILKPKNVSIEGGSSGIRRLELSGATCANLTLSGDATGYTSSSITLSPRLEVRYLFVVLGNVFINKQVSKSLSGTNASVTSDVFASVTYFATSDVINLTGLTSRLFCKGNTGITSIVKAVIGDFQSKSVSPTAVSGSGILLVAGTLNINHLSCFGDVLMRAGSTANLSGTIEGNLVVAAGATLNAVSLTVKGNVTFEAGATITWKGGTYTGTLTDPDNHFGGAVAGAYLNV